MDYFVAILPVSIPLIIFVLLVKNGYKRNILIAAAVLGVLACVANVLSGSLLEGALFGGIITFLLWYIILDVIYRVISKIQGKKKSAL